MIFYYISSIGFQHEIEGKPGIIIV